jgi:hypothetical protein
MKTEQYQEEITELNGVKLRIVTYRIGDLFHCHISNMDAGATISRAAGATKAEALQIARVKAEKRLAS